MSVIARWWLIVSSDGHAYEVRNEQPDTSPEGIDFSFKDRVVEVAPVNQPPGAVEERDRLREVLRAVLMEPDPIKRNQLAAPVLTNPGGQ